MDCQRVLHPQSPKVQDSFSAMRLLPPLAPLHGSMPQDIRRKRDSRLLRESMISIKIRIDIDFRTDKMLKYAAVYL